MNNVFFFSSLAFIMTVNSGEERWESEQEEGMQQMALSCNNPAAHGLPAQPSEL